VGGIYNDQLEPAKMRLTICAIASLRSSRAEMKYTSVNVSANVGSKSLLLIGSTMLEYRQEFMELYEGSVPARKLAPLQSALKPLYQVQTRSSTFEA
jgi:hypothetical protein